MRYGRWKRDDGVSAVEFGIIMPVLMILLMGFIEYGWVFYLDLTLTNAVREGARKGVTMTTGDMAHDEAITATENYLAAAGLNADVDATTPDDSSAAADQPS